MNDANSLTHTSRNCKYHMVFALKYRQKVFYGQKRRETGEISLSVSGESGKDRQPCSDQRQVLEKRARLRAAVQAVQEADCPVPFERFAGMRPFQRLRKPPVWPGILAVPPEGGSCRPGILL